MSVCVGSDWKNLPVTAVPCGVFWGVGEGRARWSTELGGQHGREGGTGGKGTDGEGPGEGGGQHGRGGARAGKDRARELDGCIMHRVHTSNNNNNNNNISTLGFNR
jgi:hypothetical protein